MPEVLSGNVIGARLTATAVLFLLLMQLSQPLLYCQSQANTVSYEGMKVASVELAGRPDLNERQFQDLISQSVTAPYSQQKIDQTVSALKRTGQFNDVTSLVVPEANGLRVLFVLQPASYFGIYQFGPALNRFPYSRLLLTADYPRQEPYAASRVEEARSNLLNFLHPAGDGGRWHFRRRFRGFVGRESEESRCSHGCNRPCTAGTCRDPSRWNPARGLLPA